MVCHPFSNETLASNSIHNEMLTSFSNCMRHFKVYMNRVECTALILSIKSENSSGKVTTFLTCLCQWHFFKKKLKPRVAIETLYKGKVVCKPENLIRNQNRNLWIWRCDTSQYATEKYLSSGDLEKYVCYFYCTLY